MKRALPVSSQGLALLADEQEVGYARRQHAACLMHQEEAVRTIASVASWVQKCELYSVVQLLARVQEVR